ncbi:hypothetical protein M3Y97_00345700 [Aphelenchoides bicaudatus]|nr:hypothetical protein M3Y97_00345700 [Aphelenchoides bicaudatus]
MHGLNSIAVFIFLILIFHTNADINQKKLNIKKALLQNKINEKIIAKLNLSAEHVDDLANFFGSKSAGLSFARDVSAYTTRVRKELLPESQSALLFFKKILYAYYRGVMILWRIVPSVVKLELVGIITESPTILSLFKKIGPFLPGMIFDTLSAALGLGAALG